MTAAHDRGGGAADRELGDILRRAFPGCRIEACRDLEGGVSAGSVVANLVHGDAPPRRVVVRRPEGWTAEERQRIASREHRLLSRLGALGIPAPRPCFLDAPNAAIVLEYLEGAPEFAPSDPAGMLRQMAGQLARIHAVPGAGDLGFLPRRSETVGRALRSPPERLDDALGEARVRSALASLWPWPEHNSDVLLHGDFWPGNLLWRDGRLAAVLDWEEAEVGDPLADVAVARLDLLWAFGTDAMRAFTDAYREATCIDWRNLARWDLCAALRPMSQLARWAGVYAAAPISRPDVTEASMRERHRLFVGEALRSLRLAV